MASAFFVGAGASAEAGYPITAALTYALADYVVEYRRRHNGKSSRLFEYLASVYNAKEDALEDASRTWRKYLETAAVTGCNNLPAPVFLPSIIEILSIIDIAVAEDWSFGPSSVASGSLGNNHRELVGNELRRVRDRVVEALARAFRQLHQNRSHDIIAKLAGLFSPGDTVITTNWDVLLDDALSMCTGVPPNYGTLGVRLVDFYGNDLPDQHPNGARCLLKLHGSLNWLHCRRCNDLYVNTQLMVTPQRDLGTRFPYDVTCNCGAELTGLIVTPSYFKEYKNVHLANVWRVAQKGLEDSSRWIFIGYSLPDDDFHIRGMLLRSLAIRRGRREKTKVIVIAHNEELPLQRRYLQLFADTDLEFVTNGLSGWIADDDTLPAISGTSGHAGRGGRDLKESWG